VGKSIRAVWIAVSLFVLFPTASNADAFCGPGKHLASNAFACLPGDRARSTTNSSNNSGGQVAAGLAVGGAVLSIIQSLASQSEMTDNLGGVQLDQQRHGTISRSHNRKGLVLQQAGKFNEARIAFLKASDEAVKAGNLREAKINDKNADIADALHWLRNGFEAEKAGKTTKANIAYRMGIDAAERAGDKKTANQLRKANDALVKQKGGSGSYKSTGENCALINGKYACN
jgi:hypothetical protein